MLLCGLCEERFLSNDDLRVHLEGHASQLFESSDEESEENGIINEGFDQDLNEVSLVLDCVKEEEQLQGQQKEPQREGSGESTSFAHPEAGNERRVLRERESSSETFMCSGCSYKSINKTYFKIHMNQMHLNKHKCDHCPKRYPTKGRLANHIRKEHENEDKPKLPEDEFVRIITKQQSKQKRTLYECLKCMLKTENRFNIYVHIRSVHKEFLDELYKSKGMILDDAAYHKCTECFFKTLIMYTLKKHIKTVHQKTHDFVCDLCKKNFSEKGNLIRHMKLYSLCGRKCPTEVFKCSKCSFKTINKIHFKHHLNLIHLNKHKCDHCPNRYPSKGHLANHIREKHMKDEDKPKLPEDEIFRIAKKRNKQNQRLYECLECSLKTPIKSYIYAHIRSVHRELLGELYKSKGIVLDDTTYQKCTKCFYKTLSMGNLKRHIMTVHQKTRDFVCDLCRKAFPVKENLISHMKHIHISSESSELHKCSICTFKTIHKNNLKKHLNVVHLKIRRFTCDLCRKQFSEKTNLQRHIDGVHNEKILSCNRGKKCAFRTTDRHELSRHIRRAHEKIQGFSCEICGNWYRFPSSLRFHRKKTHLAVGVTNRLTCDLCQFTTMNRQYMYGHMKRIHLKRS